MEERGLGPFTNDEGERIANVILKITGGNRRADMVLAMMCIGSPDLVRGKSPEDIEVILRTKLKERLATMPNFRGRGAR